MRESLKRPLHRYIANRRRTPLVGKLRQYAHTFINWIDNFEYDVELNGERFVLERLKPEVIFDVGANVGQWALMASEACPHAHIHCFEIVPDTFKALKRAVAHPNITLNSFGLSDERGSVTVKCFEGKTEVSTMYDYPGTPGGREVLCEVMPGDGYLERQGIARVNFLKMDIEGAEMRVLKGFERALNERRIDAVQFEYGVVNLISKVSLKDFYDYLTEHGFIIGKIYSNYVDFRPYDILMEDYRGPNYLAVRPDAARLLV